MKVSVNDVDGVAEMAGQIIQLQKDTWQGTADGQHLVIRNPLAPHTFPTSVVVSTLRISLSWEGLSVKHASAGTAGTPRGSNSARQQIDNCRNPQAPPTNAHPPSPFTNCRWGSTHWKGGGTRPPPPGRPAYAQPLSPSRQVPASMAYVTDSNRPQPLWHPPPTASLAYQKHFAPVAWEQQSKPFIP